MRKLLCCLSLFLLQAAALPLCAQPATFNGWFVYNHEQKFTGKWSLLGDVQFRSAERFSALETVLLRPGLQYEISKASSVAAGYAYLGNWEEESGERTFDLEHRAWEQYILEARPGRSEMTHRLRLEQRFLGERGFYFSQRLRYQLRTMVPLTAAKEFEKGAFVVLRNEIFLNVQNKQNVNGRFFDQNRAYGAIGYRWSKKVDVELGYLYRYQIEEEKRHNHIVHVQFSTEF